MLSVLTTCILLAHATTSEAFYGAVPKNVSVFRVILADGQQSREEYAAIRVGGDWIENASEAQSPTTRLELVFDTPWDKGRASESIRYSPGRVTIEHQPSRLRERRLEEGWKAAGYSFIEANGVRMAVPERELSLAQRAGELEATLLESRAQAENASSNAATATVTDGGGDRNLLQEWGLHGAIVLGALALLALIGKTMLLAEGGWRRVG